MRVSVAKDQKHFERDGKPFFYLADTIWSAFTNMTDEEWEEYLQLRAQQGFNVLQINILPQWDRCWVPAERLPYPAADGQHFDFAAGLQDDYFEHAAAMCEKAVQKGFVPALVVLWSNYAPGTWASELSPDNIMPMERIPDYCRKVAETFEPYEPIYLISGDTDLDTPEAKACYETVMEEMRSHCPDALMTMHIRGRYTYLPDTLVDQMDFYLYQSGHNNGYPEKCYTMPGEFREKYPCKPLVNGEPCYEQMGFSGNQYGRFDTRAVRRAAWMSVLSGACAGVTYGAHGVWNWQKSGMPFNPNTGEGFDTAKPWMEAVQFPGAWDYGFLKRLFCEKRIEVLEPDDKVANQTRGLKKETAPDGTVVTRRVYSPNTEIRMASTPDRRISLVYAPFNTRVRLAEDCRNASVHVVDLAGNRIATPELQYQDGVTSVEMCPFAQDVLLIIERS